MLIASFRVSIGVVLVFATLFPTYILLGLGKSIPSMDLFHIGGGFGIATALLAWYVSFAITMNKTARRDVVPLGHLDGPPGDKQ